MVKRKASSTLPNSARRERARLQRLRAARACRLVERARTYDDLLGRRGWGRVSRLCLRALREDPACGEATVLLAELKLRYAPQHSDAALCDLERVVTSKTGSSGHEDAAYLLALALLARDEPRRADAYLSRLGYSWRLHESVFAANSPSRLPKELSLAPPVWSVDAVVPEQFLQDIAKHFDADAPYWAEHKYGDSGYFSHSFALDETPTVAAEALIKDHLWPALKKTLGDNSSAFGGVPADVQYAEWWVHKRDAMSGHQLHWDADEHRLQSGHGLHHPVFSTVFYVDVGSAAPTLVTDREYENAEDLEETSGWLLHPQRNRLAVFDGRLLHGVVPRLGMAASGAARLTFMVGFWDSKVSRTQCDMKKPCANMMPPSKDSEATWQEPMRQWTSVDPIDKTELDRAVPPKVPKVWSRVEEPKGATGAQKRSVQQAARDKKKKNNTKRDMAAQMRFMSEDGTSFEIDDEDDEDEEEGSSFVGKYFLHDGSELTQEISVRLDPPIEYLETLIETMADEEELEAGDEEDPKSLGSDEIEFLAVWLVKRWGEPDYDELLLRFSSLRKGVKALHKALGPEILSEKIANREPAAAGVAWNLLKFPPAPAGMPWEVMAAQCKLLSEKTSESNDQAKDEASEDDDDESEEGGEMDFGYMLAGALAYAPTDILQPVLQTVLKQLLGALVQLAEQEPDDAPVDEDEEEEDMFENEIEEYYNSLEEIRDSLYRCLPGNFSPESPALQEAIKSLPEKAAKVAYAELFEHVPLLN